MDFCDTVYSSDIIMIDFGRNILSKKSEITPRMGNNNMISI